MRRLRMSSLVPGALLALSCATPPPPSTERNAPMPAHTFARRPRIVPSFFAASSTSCTWSRPWIVHL